MKILEDLIRRVGGPAAPPPPPEAPLPVYGPPALWTWHTMAGKCWNGAHRDGGMVAHVIPNNAALGLPAQHDPLCSARTHSFWSDPVTVAPERRCPDCVRFQGLKKPCPDCGRWVLFNAKPGGSLRAHRCLRPCPACGMRISPEAPHLCHARGSDA